MRESIPAIADWRTDQKRISSSYRRLATSRLPVNLYSARAQAQRHAAALIHGIADGSNSWEEFDGSQLADDTRGDRTSLLLGGVTGGVAPSTVGGRGLIAAAGAGTLFLTNIEKLSPAAQRVLCRIIEWGRYTPIGDPYPRPIKCRIIVGSPQPLVVLARNYSVIEVMAAVLGHIAIRAENVISSLRAEALSTIHPSSLAAAS